MRSEAFSLACGGSGPRGGLRRPMRPARPLLVLAALTLAWLLGGGLTGLGAQAAPQAPRYTNLAWEAPATVAQSSGAAGMVHLEAGQDGDLSLLWEDRGLWHLLLDADGGPLSTPKLLGREEPVLWSPHGSASHFARDAQGALHFVWDSDGTSIMYRKLDPQGRVLVRDVVLRSAPYGTHGASVLPAPDGNLLVGSISYEPSSAGYRFIVQRLSPDGTLLGEELAIGTGDASQPLDGALLPAAHGIEALLATTEGGLFVRLDEGGTLQSARIPFLPRGVLPAAKYDAAGRPVLAWNDWSAGSAGRVMAARIVAGSQGLVAETVFITPQSMAVSDPSLAALEDGGVLLGWEDARSGAREAYTAVLDPASWTAYPPNVKLSVADDGPGHMSVAVCRGNRIFASWAWDDELRLCRARSFGFELGGGPARVRPHGSSEASVEVRNTGGFSDTLSLSLDNSGLPAGWMAELASDEVVLPAFAGSVKVSIVLTGPESPDGGLHGAIRLLVASMGDPGLMQEMLIPVELEVRYRLEAILSPPAAQAPAGGTARFELAVTNLGDAPEVLSLTAEAAPGLLVELDEPKLRLNWSESKTAGLSARLPASSPVGEAFQFTVHLSSDASGGLVSLHGTAVVAPGVQLWLSSPVGVLGVAPGGHATFALTVGNFGTSPCPADVSVEVVLGMEGWGAEVDRSNILLAPGERADLSLTVRAPADASGRFVVRVMASARGLDASASTTLTAIAEARTGLEAHAGPRGLQTYPGAWLLVPVAVSNTGSSPEEVTIDLSAPPGWSAEARRQGAMVRQLVLAPGATEALSAALLPPAEAKAGDYSAKVLFTGRSGASAEAELSSTVLQVFDLSLQTSTPSLRAAPGETAVALLSLRNLGNGPDRVGLDVELPAGWRAELTDFELRPLAFGPGQLALPSGGSAGLMLGLSMPASAAEEMSEVAAVATSQSGLRAHIALRIGRLLPDLSLKVSYSPPRLEAGRSALATVTVSNTGEVAARQVLVAFSADGGAPRLERISLIPGGSEKTATFSWTPDAGRHVLRFEADPEHTVLEREEGNNLFIEKVSIAGPTPEAAAVPGAVLAAGAAAVLLGALGAAAGGTETGKYWFLGVLFVPLYTKIKKDDILDHFLRGQVYGYIKANPGEHYNSIKKALDLKNGTLMYHLKTLEREEFIKAVADGRFKRFYPKEMKVPEPSEELVLRMNHIQHEMLKIIRDSPGISQKEIAAKIGLSTPTVHYHINIMMGARVIYIKRAGRETQCFVEDSGEGLAG